MLDPKTTRLQAMVDWYQKVVGAEVVFQFPGGAWLTNDEANHRIAFLSSPHMSDNPEKISHTGKPRLIGVVLRTLLGSHLARRRDV